MSDVTDTAVHSDPVETTSADAPQPAAAQPASALPLYKIALVVGLALATIIPSTLISSLIEERETRQNVVEKDLARTWGPQQDVYSPILIIPYQPGPDRPRQYVKVAATRLQLAASLDPQQRRRGLFAATVYEAKLDMQGAFAVPAEARLREVLSDKDGRFLWGDSVLAFGSASALTGLRASDNIVINGTTTQWLPCAEAVRPDTACRGAAMVLAGAPLDPAASGGRALTFKATVSLRGTSAINVLFAGKELDATIRSPWPSPSFGGDVLPVSSSITAQGFEARWETIEFGSPRVAASPAVVDPTMWKNGTIGVDLIEATPIYRMINRVAKYGLLLVVLSFATYFFFELLSRLRIHVVQYGLLGLSLSLFSLLLLSLSEPIGYTLGYWVSAGLVLLQSSIYTAAVARRIMPALVFALMLGSLFAFLYVLLGLETYSLLIGTLALFVVISVLMILTQRIRWIEQLRPAQA
jgi:inner membrane protein